MIYPSRRSILLAAGLAPFSLLLGVVASAYWYLGLAALAFLLGMIAMDIVLGLRVGKLQVSCEGPATAGVGSTFEVTLYAHFLRAPAAIVEAALGSTPLLTPTEGARRRAQTGPGHVTAAFEFTALRRGSAMLGPLWLRWSGPLGLVWHQRVLAVEHVVLITPDIRPVREKTTQMLHRDASFGVVAQQQVGEGAEFEALAEFRPGMDRRSIDWKQSARHTMLLAKEYRTERNNNIIMAIDAGRSMCDPLAGVPRLDRAVSAALLTAFVALRDGDRVGFFGFDSHPRVASKAVSGQRAFALLQKVAARIDYSPNETNYTLALATLAEGLQRRSLIVVFTDFADTISAELMLHAVGTLLGRHLVLFVVMLDEELETVVASEPNDPADVTSAVTAAALLNQRRLVLARLRRLGVHVLETAHDDAGPALVNAYLDLKRRSML